jgi:HAD superfamily hydrolase (TIGR01509 family)
MPSTAMPALDRIAFEWGRAFDADDRALSSAAVHPLDLDVAKRRRDLAQERVQTADLLARVARLSGVQPAPWLSPIPVSRQMLGLPPQIRACLFDLDGVLTDSGTLHARAWADTFDPFLLELYGQTGWQYVPFDPETDYRTYIDGRPRLEGVHLFLNGRGIQLPEGHRDDPSDAATAYGLARRKNDALTRGLHAQGVKTVGGARRYLEAAASAGLARVAISASTRMSPMLELAGLAALVDECVDADLIAARGLRSRPAPDLLLAACTRAAVRPAEAVTFTQSPEGIAAGRAAGLVVIGVGTGERAELLRGFGAEVVVPSLGSLLDRRLALPYGKATP